MRTVANITNQCSGSKKSASDGSLPHPLHSLVVDLVQYLWMCHQKLTASVQGNGVCTAKIKKDYNISDDPKERAIVGISLGAVCAFNVAWQYPDVFGKVICHCGSFVNIRGADKFPEMIRQTPAKPLKVFLQSGKKDLNVIFGSWAIKNKEMAVALEYAGYDHKFVFGKGGHSLKHGAAIFPDTLRWLWSDLVKQ